MDNTIQFPKGYRYDSNMDLFKAAVKCTKELLEDEKAVILYQFTDVITAKIFLSKNEFEERFHEIGWDDFIDILNNEIIYLLRQNFEDSIGVDSGLLKYLKENEVPEKMGEEIVRLKLEKCIYVDKYLGGEKEKNRYRLKKHSLLKKMSDIDYELNRTIAEEDLIYATIRMSINSTLESKDFPNSVSDIFNQNKEDITFICDRSDIEYLIQKFKKIQEML